MSHSDDRLSVADWMRSYSMFCFILIVHFAAPGPIYLRDFSNPALKIELFMSLLALLMHHRYII